VVRAFAFISAPKMGKTQESRAVKREILVRTRSSVKSNVDLVFMEFHASRG
jgi:hypothetical protein